MRDEVRRPMLGENSARFRDAAKAMIAQNRTPATFRQMQLI
jgi:hypothetical protein